MLKDILPWLWDETLLQNLVHELSLIPLIGVMSLCIVLLLKGADWMIDGVVKTAYRDGWRLRQSLFVRPPAMLSACSTSLFRMVGGVSHGNPNVA